MGGVGRNTAPSDKHDACEDKRTGAVALAAGAIHRGGFRSACVDFGTMLPCLGDLSLNDRKSFAIEFDSKDVVGGEFDVQNIGVSKYEILNEDGTSTFDIDSLNERVKQENQEWTAIYGGWNPRKSDISVIPHYARSDWEDNAEQVWNSAAQPLLDELLELTRPSSKLTKPSSKLPAANSVTADDLRGAFESFGKLQNSDAPTDSQPLLDILSRFQGKRLRTPNGFIKFTTPRKPPNSNPDNWKLKVKTDLPFTNDSWSAVETTLYGPVWKEWKQWGDLDKKALEAETDNPNGRFELWKGWNEEKKYDPAPRGAKTAIEAWKHYLGIASAGTRKRKADSGSDVNHGDEASGTRECSTVEGGDVSHLWKTMSIDDLKKRADCLKEQYDKITQYINQRESSPEQGLDLQKAKERLKALLG